MILKSCSLVHQVFLAVVEVEPLRGRLATQTATVQRVPGVVLCIVLPNGRNACRVVEEGLEFSDGGEGVARPRPE